MSQAGHVVVTDSFYARAGKRVLDLVLSCAGLLVLSPVLLLVALAVKLDSPGSVFYRQERAGFGGRSFHLFKFRSMVVGAEHKGARIRVLPGDPRITRLGRLLRRLSIDEIPQLFNVVAGSMSLVGPRPGLPSQVRLYDEFQRQRLLVKPGITGWAQVNGRRSIGWDRRIELDVEYVARISFLLDVQVLCRTIPSVLGGGGLISDGDYWADKARRLDEAGGDQPGKPGPEPPGRSATDI